MKLLFAWTIALCLVLGLVATGQVTRSSSGGDPSTTILAPDTYANLPAAGTAGRIFPCTNCPYVLIRDTGSAWTHFLSGFGQVTLPVSGDYSWDNQGTASVSIVNGGVMLSDALPASDSVLRGRYDTAPSVPYTITGRMTLMANIAPLAGGKLLSVGLMFRQSSDGKLATCGIQYRDATGWQWLSRKWNTSSSIGAAYVEETFGTRFGLAQPPEIIHLQVTDNNTNRICSASLNGYTWFDFDTQTRTDFLTGDQVGFFISGHDAGGGSKQTDLHLLSWEEE